jgi:hypothetical protein
VQRWIFAGEPAALADSLRVKLELILTGLTPAG